MANGVKQLDDDGPPLARSARCAARVAVVGVFLGAIASVVGQVIVASADPPGTGGPLPSERIVGAVLLGAASGIALGLVSLATLAIQKGRAGRLTLGAIGVVTGVLVWVHAFGIALRAAMGSHITLSGLQYFANSGTGIARELLRKTGGQLALLVGLAAIIGGGLAFALGRALRGKSRTWLVRAELGATAMLSVGAITYWCLPIPRSFALGVRQSAPEFAFVASFETPPATTTKLDNATSTLVARSLVSPPIEAGPAWREAVTTLGKRPNIVFITAEATNIHHLGYEGYERPTTPNLDKLVGQSLVAHRAYTAATHSNYSQPAILSSLFPRRGSDLDMYGTIEYPRFLLHDAAKALGYTTAVISSQDENWQGMRTFQMTGNIDYYHHSPDFRGEHLDIGTEDLVPDALTADEVLRWIDGERVTGKPFEVYVNFQATHFPYSMPEDAPHPFTPYEPKGTFNYVFYEKSEMQTVVNRYDNVLHYIDAQVGKLVDGLASRGIEGDTILVFVADHGELFWEHEMVTHGRTLFESEALVPLVIHWPNGIKPGHVNTPVSTLDILPTIADAMGVPPHPSWQGESMLPYEKDARDDAATPDPRHAAIFMNIQGWKHLDAIVCLPFKLIYDPESEKNQMFNVVSDPGEIYEISASEPKIADDLAKTLHAQIGAQLDYHQSDKHPTKTQFAPRLLNCP
jgi:arylsulfatase A-like enzyme